MLKVILTEQSTNGSYYIKHSFSHVISVYISNHYNRELCIKYIKENGENERVTMNLPENVEIRQEEEE